MEHIDDILQTVTGNQKGSEKEALISLLDEDKSVRDEYLKIKNAWALISSTRQMPEYQVENLYLGFQRRKNARQKFFILGKNILLKYAAVFVFAVGLTSLFFAVQPYFFKQGNSHLRYTTVYADNGQVSKIMLPDSSVVWLNSGSKITYNTNFAVNNREINLVGQAFFKAAKNKRVPMRVFCDDLEVKVLGTRFDVCAYPNEKIISVALESGKVEMLNTKIKSFHYELRPGEMAQYDIATGQLNTALVNTRDFTSWKEGVLIFRDDPMPEVLTKLQRRYNIDIEVEQPEVYKPVFTATIKNETLEEVFKSIGFACSVNSKIVRSEDPNIRTKVILSTKQYKQ